MDDSFGSESQSMNAYTDTLKLESGIFDTCSIGVVGNGFERCEVLTASTAG